MCMQQVAQALEFPVDRTFAKSRLERQGIEKDIDVLGKSAR